MLPSRARLSVCQSHPARGAWIEIKSNARLQRPWRSHPARGAWIEIVVAYRAAHPGKSHPARGAWIEMFCWQINRRTKLSHPARGAWIEITHLLSCQYNLRRRTPQGVRGLKSRLYVTLGRRRSRTPQGVRGLKYRGAVAGFHRGAGRTPQGVRGLKCSSSRMYLQSEIVAPRKGCVD